MIWSQCYDFAMRREFPAAQYFSYILGCCVLTILLGLFLALPLSAQTPKPNLPDPIKFINKFDIVWNVVDDVLDEMDFSIELQDPKSGKIITRPLDFIIGSLTSSEVNKVAIKSDTTTGTLLKARYSVEALLEIVSPAETMVTISTNMEALNRDVDGTEKWIPLESLGTFERRILGKISMKLIGSDLELERKKGFWERDQQPVDPRRPKVLEPPRQPRF